MWNTVILIVLMSLSTIYIIHIISGWFKLIDSGSDFSALLYNWDFVCNGMPDVFKFYFDGY